MQREIEEQKIVAVKKQLTLLREWISDSKITDDNKTNLLSWMQRDLKMLDDRTILMNVSAVSYKSLKKKLHERFVAVKLEEGIVDQIDKPLARLRKSGQLCTVRLCEIIHAITYTQMISELINESANFVMSEVQSRSTGRTEKFKAVICKNYPCS